MSITISGILVMLLSVFMPKMGITIGNDALTTTISTLFTIGGAAWAWYGRYRLGGITAAGLRKL